MELQFLNMNNLDRPVHKVGKDILLTKKPFFNDYYTVIYLKKVFIPKEGYKPIIINDPELVKNYGGTNLQELVSQIMATGELVKFNILKIVYRIVVLSNGWWCAYIEKRYIWDNFISIGVVTIVSPSRSAVLDFFNKHFQPKMIVYRAPTVSNNEENYFH